MSVVRELRDLMNRISRVEQQISKLPSRISSAVGGSGGSTGDPIWYVRQTYEDLPDATQVATTAMARLDNPDEEYELNGAVFVVNPTHDGWHSINFFV